MLNSFGGESTRAKLRLAFPGTYCHGHMLLCTPMIAHGAAQQIFIWPLGIFCQT